MLRRRTESPERAPTKCTVLRRCVTASLADTTPAHRCTCVERELTVCQHSFASKARPKTSAEQSIVVAQFADGASSILQLLVDLQKDAAGACPHTVKALADSPGSDQSCVSHSVFCTSGEVSDLTLFSNAPMFEASRHQTVSGALAGTLCTVYSAAERQQEESSPKMP